MARDLVVRIDDLPARAHELSDEMTATVFGGCSKDACRIFADCCPRRECRPQIKGFLDLFPVNKCEKW